MVDFFSLFVFLPRHNIPNVETLIDCGLRRLVDGRTEQNARVQHGFVGPKHVSRAGGFTQITRSRIK
jgi:hypothetical protein